MTKLQKISKKLSDDFNEYMDKAFLEKYGIEIETQYNLFAGRIISTRKDEVDFTPEQFAYIAGYSEGFAKAMVMIQNKAYR